MKAFNQYEEKNQLNFPGLFLKMYCFKKEKYKLYSVLYTKITFF